jgi:hypothetical protein
MTVACSRKTRTAGMLPCLRATETAYGFAAPVTSHSRSRARDNAGNVNAIRIVLDTEPRARRPDP